MTGADRHSRCGGEWRGPFHTDGGPVDICNTCGEEEEMTGQELAEMAQQERIESEYRRLGGLRH